MKKTNLMKFIGSAFIFISLLFLSRTQKDEPGLQTRITAEEAKVIAYNNIKTTPEGVELSHPNHFVQFESDGVLFQPKQGPEWKWQLEHFGTPEESLEKICAQSVKPKMNQPRIIAYHYGNVIEEYHAKAKTIEQRFVLEKPLDLDSHDLVIRGHVACDGDFEALDQGWVWKDSQGQVALGDVTVFDAQGNVLAASMNVSAHQTEIVVDAQSLATATYPVTIDPEIGASDFRISDMGPDGNPSFFASAPRVAYNSFNKEYLVVWDGVDDTPPLGGGEREIFGQRIDASTGLPLGLNDFRISDMGPDGNGNFSAVQPAVAYNSTDNEYLVVWSGFDDVFSFDGREIFGQRLDATGQEIGANDFRISNNIGPDAEFFFQELDPDVVYNSINNEYFVVWRGDDDSGSLLADGETEIFGQRLDATGQEIGADDFRISDMGPDGDANFGVSFSGPAVAHNVDDNEYLVVWSADDNMFFVVDEELEIFGQRLDATGQEIGVNDFRISDMGPNGTTNFFAESPDVAYSSVDNQYLVVWEGTNDEPPLMGPEREIYGQRLNALGAELGANDFRISNIGPDGFTEFLVSDPKIVYNSLDNEYLVIWQANGDVAPLALGEFDIFGQWLDSSTGSELGDNDFRISDFQGKPSLDSTNSGVVYNSRDNEYLAVWQGDDDVALLVDNEFEIFGQRLKRFTLTSDVDKLPLSTGGVQNLTLDFGPSFANMNYLILGSLAGTTSGTPLGGKTVPLNVDAYFLSTLHHPNGGTLPNGFGVLDANGQATIQFDLPAGLNLPSGTQVNHAAVVIDVQPTLIKVSTVSNAEPCTLE